MAASVESEAQSILDCDDKPQPLVRVNSIRRVRASAQGTGVEMPAKLLERSSSSPRENPTFKPYFDEYILMAEYKLLAKKLLPGVYVIPSANDANKWFGVMLIRQGLYQGGIFRFTIYMADFSNSKCPSVVFDCPVFHPLVDPETFKLDVERRFPSWRRTANHIWEVVAYANSIFYQIDTASPWNPEASTLYETDEQLYILNVKESLEKCAKYAEEAPLIEDRNAIRFSQWDNELHGNIQYANYVNCTENGISNTRTRLTGVSWVNRNTCQVFGGNGSSS